MKMMNFFVRAVRYAYGKHINKSFMIFYVCTNINSDIILLFHYLLLARLFHTIKAHAKIFITGKEHS